MGTWFPGYRTGTPEQIADYWQAQYDLERNGRYEMPLVRAKVIREETPRYLDLNDRVQEKAGPLSRWQQWWHGQRAAEAEERDFDMLQQASDRQDRDARKGRTR